MSVETPERAWTGKWGEPIAGSKGEGYGAERFYFPASDSSRVLNLDPASRARGTFGGDTATATAKVPSWRHSGVDISAAKGTRVLAPAAGVVADVGDYTLTGRTAIIDHGHGVFTAYFHLDTTNVRRGDQIRAGRVIGRVGATGLATGPHLHYGVYVHGKDVDPAAWRDMPTFAQGGKSKATAGN
jgi:murein DD-endopeptidase MepM/ murein hydrolase activator NlpD